MPQRMMAHRLKWNVFPGEGPGPHPAVLVIHGGGFRDEPVSPKTLRAARDAAEAGFNAFVPESSFGTARWIARSEVSWLLSGPDK